MAHQYAKFDPSAASPQLIIGWYDNSSMNRYQNLPPVADTLPAGFVEVDATTWSAHLADLMMSNWTVANGVVWYKGAPAAT